MTEEEQKAMEDALAAEGQRQDGATTDTDATPNKKDVTSKVTTDSETNVEGSKTANSLSSGTKEQKTSTLSSTSSNVAGKTQKVVSGGYTKTVAPQTTVTKTMSGLSTPEGQAYADALRKSTYESYGLDANGDINRSDQKRVGELLGFDPEVYKKEQMERERVARFKRKEAGWRNALGVIGDVATAAAGGNVYARSKDTTGAEARKEELEAQENIRKIGNALPTAIQARRRSADEEIAKRLDKYAQRSSYKVETKQGGDVVRSNQNNVYDLENNKSTNTSKKSTSNLTGATNRQTVSTVDTESKTTTSSTKNVNTVALENNGSNGVGNSWNGISMTEKNSAIVKLNVNDANGQPYESYSVRVPKSIGEAYVKNIYDRMLALAQDNPNIKEYLIDHDMVEEKGDGILTFRPNFDFKQAMAAGWILDDQFIMNEMLKIASGALQSGQITQEQYNDIQTNIQKVNVAPVEKKKDLNLVEWFMDFFKPTPDESPAPAAATSPAKRGRSKSDKDAAANNNGSVERGRTR